MTILTEKESVAKNYAQALKLKKTAKGLYESADGKIKLTYAAGHLYTLYDMADYDAELLSWYKTKKLPYIPKTYLTKADDGYKKAKKDIRTNCEKYLREAIQKRDEIVIATDPDREGEVIARFILDKLKADYKNVTRVWCCEGLNPGEVIKGLKERKNDMFYDSLFSKGFSQKKSDWVTGLNLTRLFTVIENDGTVWSIGRVQTAVLQELYDRQMEILLFKSREYYEIKITDEKGNEWYVSEKSFSGEKIFDKEKAFSILSEIKKESLIKAESVTSKTEARKAPLLYDSSSLAADCNVLFGYDVDKTLAVSQSLYNEEGAVSYPRTASRFLKEEDAENYNQLYQKLMALYKLENKGYSLKKENRNVFDTKKCEGHHAIIPSKIWNGDREEKKNVYDLVLRSFLMAGMDDYVTEKTEAVGNAEGYKLFSEGKKTIKEGWKILDLHKKENEKSIDVKEGENIKIRDIQIVTKKTEPKKYYTQASLITWMKNPGGKDEGGEKIIGIGTQATQASIIRTLYDRSYIKTCGKHIEVTERGIKLIEKIRDVKILDLLTRVETTTRWEKLNEENPDQFLFETEESVRKIFKIMEEKLKTAVEKKEGGTCPFCGGKILAGKKGWYCSGYKDKGCENSLSFQILGNKIDDALIKKILDEKSSGLLSGVKKDGDKCSFEIKVSEEGKFILVFSDAREETALCPKCNSPVFSFPKVYKCSSQSCDFFIWKKTSGMEITKDMASSLCRGESVRTVQHKKDGSTANVYIKLDDEYETIKITYENS